MRGGESAERVIFSSAMTRSLSRVLCVPALLNWKQNWIRKYRSVLKNAYNSNTSSVSLYRNTPCKILWTPPYSKIPYPNWAIIPSIYQLSQNSYCNCQKWIHRVEFQLAFWWHRVSRGGLGRECLRMGLEKGGSRVWISLMDIWFCYEIVFLICSRSKLDKWIIMKSIMIKLIIISPSISAASGESSSTSSSNNSLARSSLQLPPLILRRAFDGEDEWPPVFFLRDEEDGDHILLISADDVALRLRVDILLARSLRSGGSWIRPFIGDSGITFNGKKFSRDFQPSSLCCSTIQLRSEIMTFQVDFIEEPNHYTN